MGIQNERRTAPYTTRATAPTPEEGLAVVVAGMGIIVCCAITVVAAIYGFCAWVSSVL